LPAEGCLASIERAVTPDLKARRYLTTKLELVGSHTDIADGAQQKEIKMLNHVSRSIIMASLLTTLLFSANPLAAAETRSIAIQSRDLNLAKSADRATLQQRIAHAVDRVCGPAHARTTADAEAYSSCAKAASASAAIQYDAVVAKAMAERKVAGNR